MTRVIRGTEQRAQPFDIPGRGAGEQVAARKSLEHAASYNIVRDSISLQGRPADPVDRFRRRVPVGPRSGRPDQEGLGAPVLAYPCHLDGIAMAGERRGFEVEKGEHGWITRSIPDGFNMLIAAPLGDGPSLVIRTRPAQLRRTPAVEVMLSTSAARGM